MGGKTAAIIGATGMIGQYLIKNLLEDKEIDYVRLIVRRPIPKTHDKIEVKLVDFKDRESLHLALENVDMLFCAIGTTQKKVKGNNELYREIDFDIPVNAAQLCKETGCEKYIIVSAIGANAKSSNFYLKLKGEVEEALEKVGLKSLHIFQPSVLLGHRNEKRSGESILQNSMKFISPLLVGGWKKYRAVSGEKVAKAMIRVSKEDKTGVYRYTFDQL